MANVSWGDGTQAPKPVAAPYKPPPTSPTFASGSYPVDTSDVFGRAVSVANPTLPTQYGGSTSTYSPGGDTQPASSGGSFKFPDANTWMQDALEKLGIGSLDANLKALRERAIIQAGDPALAQLAGFGLDPQAGVFAQQNYLSGNADLARLDKAHGQSRKNIVNRLAASGLLRSGDLGYLNSEEDAAYGNQQYDYRQKLLAQLQQYMQDYLDRKNALKQNVWQAYQNAYNSFLQNPGAYGG